MNKIYNVLLTIYFFVVIPLSGILAYAIIENSLFRVVGVLGIAIIHGCITDHFFDASGKIASVVMILCIVSTGFYSITFL